MAKRQSLHPLDFWEASVAHAKRKEEIEASNRSETVKFVLTIISSMRFSKDLKKAC